jgi:hypothetical protein
MDQMKPHTSKNTEAHGPPKKNASRSVGREDAKMLNIGTDERSILTLYLRQSNLAATPPHDLERIHQIVRRGLHLADLGDLSPWHFDDTRGHGEEIIDSTKVLTFLHRFSRTVSCKMRVIDFTPRPGHLMQCNCEWTGRPKPKHIAQYRQWVVSTAAILAQRWKQRILYCLGVSSTCTEIWAFEQGSLPS